MQGKRQWRFRYMWFVRLLVSFMWLIAFLKWSERGQDIWLPWLAPVLVPWAAWALIGTDVALTRLAVKRRTFTPRNQRRLLKSKNERTDHRIGTFRRRVQFSIWNGLIVLDKLSKKRRNSYDQLGVGETRLNKGGKQRRLEKEEESRRETERRKLRSQQDQDRRNRSGDTSSGGV